MIEALQIPLAAGDGDAIEMLVILAFVVISIVSGLIQKANKTKKQREEQEAAGRRPQQTSPQPRMPPGRADTPPVRAEEVQALQPQADTRTVPQARSSRQSG